MFFFLVTVNGVVILTTHAKGRPNEYTFYENLLIRSHLSKIYKTYILPILEYGCEKSLEIPKG